MEAMLFLFFLALGVPSIKGFEHLIQTEVAINGSYCYTNNEDSGIAFVRNLDAGMLGRIRTTYQGILNNVYDSGASDCNLVLGKCDAWDFDDFDKVTNIGGDFPELTDRRWNDLTEVITGKGRKYGKLLDFQKGFKGHVFVSLQAKHSAILYLTKDATEKAGSKFVLVGPNGKLNSTTENCTSENQQINCTTQIIPYNNIGKGWVIIRLKIEADNKIAATNNGGAKTLMLFASDANDDTAIFKLHKYDMLKPKRADARLTANITLSSPQPLCLDISYYSGERSGKGLALDVEILNSTGQEVIDVPVLGASPINSWATYRLKTKILDIGYYNLSLKPSSVLTYIGDVRFCAAGTEMVHTLSPDVVDCQSLKPSHNSNLTTGQNDLTPEEEKRLCKNIGIENCTIVVNEKGHGVISAKKVYVDNVEPRGAKVTNDSRVNSLCACTIIAVALMMLLIEKF